MPECSSSVGIRDIGEMKGRHLTLVRRELFKVEVYRKLLKAPEMVLLKVPQGLQIFCNHLLAKVKHLCFNSLEIGVPTPL